MVQAVQTQMQTNRNLYDAYVNDSDLIGTHSRLQSAVNLTDWMAGEGKDVTNPMLDIDDFKQHNDKYGHIAGDDALRNFAEALHSTTRTMNWSTGTPALTISITLRGRFSLATISSIECAPSTLVPLASLARKSSTFEVVRLKATTV